LIDVIRYILMNIHEIICIYETKYLIDVIRYNLFKPQFFLHLNYFLCKISVYNVHIEVLIENIKIDIIISIYMHFHEFLFSYEAKNDKKLKQHV
jgi:hypothetical protein